MTVEYKIKNQFPKTLKNGWEEEGVRGVSGCKETHISNGNLGHFKLAVYFNIKIKWKCIIKSKWSKNTEGTSERKPSQVEAFVCVKMKNCFFSSMLCFEG